LNKDVKIFPKRVAKYNFVRSSDTVQEYIGNNFTLRTEGILMPFPLSVSYLWYAGDGDSTFFATFRHSYANPGRYRTALITMIGVNSKPTGCKDTLYLDLVVTGIKPFRNLQITPDSMELTDNEFSFSLSDTGLSAVKWYFGDGDSSDQAVTTHSYKDIGTYKVKVKATTKGGKSAISTKDLFVFSRTTDIKSNTEKNIAILKVYPNPASTVLHLSFKELDNYTILVYQADGKLCLSSEQKSLEERLELNELVSGIHHIEILKNGIHQQGFNIFIDK
jgi:chitodextrinase